MKKDERPLWQKVLIPLGIAILTVLAVSLLTGAFTDPEKSVRMKKLSDAFLSAGALFFAIGVLSWVASKGFFDLAGYATFHVLGFFIPRFENSDRGKAKDLYEYKKMKDQKGRYWLPHVTLIGAGFIVISILFAFLYHAY